MRWGRSLSNKAQLEVVDDFVHNRIVGEESDDLHCPPALRTDQGVDFIDFANHLGPAAAGDPRALLLDDDELAGRLLRLTHLAPVGIGVQAEVTNRDLALVGDMRGHPSDELQIVHLLHLFGVFPIPVANLGRLMSTSRLKIGALENSKRKGKKSER